jgi:hypothetical protein
MLGEMLSQTQFRKICQDSYKLFVSSAKLGELSRSMQSLGGESQNKLLM